MLRRSKTRVSSDPYRWGVEVRAPSAHVESPSANGGSEPIVIPITEQVAPTTVAREPFPLVLHRRARHAVRTHVYRDALRIGALLTADLAVLVALRVLIDGVRDSAWLGAPIGAVVLTLVPHGTFPFVQLSCSVTLALWALGTYRSGDYRRQASALYTGALIGLGLVFWSKLWTIGSVALVVGFGVSAFILGTSLLLVRLLVDRIVRVVRPESKHAARTLVVGAAADAREALESAALSDRAEFNVVGYLDVSRKPPRDALGGLSDLVSVIEAKRIDTIVLSGRIEEALFCDLVNVADDACCAVISLPLQFARAGVVPQLIWRRGVPTLQLTRPGLRGQQLAIKRCVDVAASAIATIVLAPVYAAIAFAVKLSSPGPVIFRQERVGAGGRVFQIYKFRTMVRDAEEKRDGIAARSIYGDGRLFKVKDDPRVTRVGRFLRRTSLDELPQLWNVMRGDMSLVGPRPPVPQEVALYEEHHYARFHMKPGMTGPWQVGGRNNLTSFEEIVRLEADYMRYWSIGKDIEILLRTLPAVLGQRGAH
jgi:exopolysaccharide biosynthesis polyprenyl glycosylphosphotransferase